MGWPAPSLYPYSPYNSAHQWIRAELSSLTPDDSTRQLSSKAAFLQQEQDHITTKPVVQKAPGVTQEIKKYAVSFGSQSTEGQKKQEGR